MRLQILSDLHLDVKPFTHKQVEGVDCVIVAGDLMNGAAVNRSNHRVINYFNSIPQDLTTIYVLGNHDFYGSDRNQTVAWFRANLPHVELLDNESFDIGDYRIHGSTLWSPCASPIRHKFPEELTDFTLIKDISLDLMRDRFVEATFWLEQSLSASPVTNIVVTHFLPTFKSVHKQYEKSLLNPYFVGDVEHLMDKAALWVHGHTHCSMDYRLGNTRLVCNPRGYGDENKGEFNASLTVDLP
jgi:predicted phosphodiesterase